MTARRRQLITIGYQGRSAAEVVDLLRDAGVTLLADVRLTPMSRQPGLSKRRLAASLSEVGIEYLHLPMLGNPRDNRSAYRRGEPQARALLEQRLNDPAAAQALDELAGRIDADTVALLCFELDAAEYHRTQVAHALLRRRPTVRVRDL